MAQLRERGVRLIAADSDTFGWTPDAAVTPDERAKLVEWHEELRRLVLEETGGRLTTKVETFTDEEKFAVEWVSADGQLIIGTSEQNQR